MGAKASFVFFPKFKIEQWPQLHYNNYNKMRWTQPLYLQIFFRNHGRTNAASNLVAASSEIQM